MTGMFKKNLVAHDYVSDIGLPLINKYDYGQDTYFLDRCQGKCKVRLDELNIPLKIDSGLSQHPHLGGNKTAYRLILYRRLNVNNPRVCQAGIKVRASKFYTGVLKHTFCGNIFCVSSYRVTLVALRVR